MDEKLKVDTSRLWTENDSLAQNTLKTTPAGEKAGNWMLAGGIILGITIILVVLFNTRSN